MSWFWCGTPAATALVRHYFVSHRGQAGFDYAVRLADLIDYCAVRGGEDLKATALGAVACGLISDTTKLGDLLEELRGQEIGGRVVSIEIDIPYYDTTVFVTNQWDEQAVRRLVLNDPYARPNEGLPAKIWSGNAWLDSSYTAAQPLVKYVHWILQLSEVPSSLRPAKKCKCHTAEENPSNNASCSMGNSGQTCGFSIFRGKCAGFCRGRLYLLG